MIYRIPLIPLPDVQSIGHIKYRNGWSCEYRHGINVLIFVLSGEFIYDFEDGRRLKVGAGCHLLIPGDAAYRVTASDDCDFYFAHFLLSGSMTGVGDEVAVAELRRQAEIQRNALNDNYPDPPADCLYISENMFLGERGESVRYRFSRCEEFRYGSSPLDRLRLINSFLNMLLTMAATTGGKLLDTPKMSSTLTKMTGYIEENYTRPISLEGLASEFGLSKQYIMRLFRKQLGTTVSHYVNTVKLRKSLDLLRFTGLSVGEVAYSLGYSSSYYFCRLFKQYFHLTPTEYQRSRPANK